MKPSRIVLGSWFLGACLSACSFIIDPDPSKLRGPSDAGTRDSGMQDAGADAGECPATCDDRIACTRDTCTVRSCRHRPDDTLCDDDQRCHPTQGCISSECKGPEDCDDGNPCTAERCVASQCTYPREPSGTECDDGSFCTANDSCDSEGVCSGTTNTCSDGLSCTADSCDEEADACLHAPRNDFCDDGVACTEDACAGQSAGNATGCTNVPNDDVCNSYCFVGAVCDVESGCAGGGPRDCSDNDVCTVDSCDYDAMMCVRDPVDEDNDGFPAEQVSGETCAGTDCRDDLPDVNPDATEACDGTLDEDCDDLVDEGCVSEPN